MPKAKKVNQHQAEIKQQIDVYNNLVARRDSITNEINRFQIFLETKCIDLKNPVLLIDLTTRLSTIEPLIKEFRHVQFEIEQVCSNNQFDETMEQENERESFENLYFSNISLAKSIIDKINAAQTAPSAPSVLQPFSTSSSLPYGQYSNSRLPPIPLPNFSGSYETWTNFKDTFITLIEKNSQINNVEKFYYLKSSLQGEAAQIISSLAATEDNYVTAWSLLQERYENKKAIIHSHIKCIFELNQVKDDSHVSLRKLLDGFQNHYKSLQNLSEPVGQWSSILIYLLTLKLDYNSRKEWEHFSRNIDNPSTEDFVTFLSQRCRFLESLDFKLHSKKSYVPNKSEKYESKTFLTQHKNTISCPLCKDSHFIYSCKKFIDLPVSNRLSQAKSANLCTNCLRPGHRQSNCTSMYTCKTCQGKHHSLLHMHPNRSRPFSPQNNSRSNAHSNSHSNNDHTNTHTNNTIHSRPFTSDNTTIIQPHENAPILPDANNAINHTPSQSLYCSNSNQNSFVLLSTAFVEVFDSNNQPILCKAVLDNGSQSNFITQNLLDKLNLPFDSIKMSVSGISEKCTDVSKRTQVKIKSIHDNFSINIPTLVINKITEKIPPFSLNISDLNIPTYIKLADHEFLKPAEIDVLLGAGVFYNLLNTGQIKLGKNNPTLQNTKLGWIVSGPISLLTTNIQHTSSLKCTNITNNDLQNSLQLFWNSEETTEQLPKNNYSKEETECENHFKTTTHRDSSGRFILSLPLKPNFSQLGDTFQIALKRFYALEQKLDKNPEIKQSYCDFISEYKTLGHMSEISPDIANPNPTYPSYYLPHHCVEKSDSLTTRLRVVFDGSAASSSGISINDCLKVGPTVQSDLFTIILRFRQHNFVLTGDIAKMYRQFLIEPNQRCLQRILWRDQPQDNITHFELNTVTYGMSSSAFLATRCLNQISNEIQESNPVESHVIKHDIYVDDVITGTSDEESLLTLRNNLIAIFKSYGLDLRKFYSNSQSVISDLTEFCTQSKNLALDESNHHKTLGICWSPEQDIFIYNSQIDLSTKPVTKRVILSLISQIFDPLGLLGPMVLQIKILLQKLWLLKLNWDDPVPTDIFQIWKNFTHYLSLVDYFKIPRQVTIKKFVFLELHGFSDSSINAFGACIYVRSMDSYGNIAVHLLTAKSRVAPLKAVSLPRLELCGALVLSRLMDKVLKALNCQPTKVCYYTDSTIVLCWLSLEPRQLKTYVCNRISEIQQITDLNSWYHVSSSENPADIISRGMSPQDLKSCSLWWHGPSFLSHPENLWPNNNHISNFKSKKLDSETLELNSKSIVLTSTNSKFSLFEKFSDYNKLINVTAYCLRFIHNLKLTKHTRQVGELTVFERENALATLITLAQTEAFSNDLVQLKSKNILKPQSKLKSLNPFLDKNGILRVGGRLQYSNLDYYAKHPILLPKSHTLTRLIISHIHQSNFHPGTQSTLSFVRQKFWPIQGKSAVKSVIHKCITCYKQNPKSLNTLMGNLPEPRVNPSRPFLHTGMDYAGYFMIKDSKLRNRKLIKAYLCIFVCLATRAVHFELVSDLTSQGFLAMLKRFVSRRGLCQHLYSDNGTNFVGANSELQDIYKFPQSPEFQTYAKNHMIQFHFNPAGSPHFGGLWESVVKSFKHHLRRVISDQNPLTYEEFYTFVVQVEAVLNSRPLLPITDDPNDLETLTPGHFLVGHPLNLIPDLDLQTTPMNRLTRYQMLQCMLQHFWKRWSSQYLHTLHERSKWRFKTDMDNLQGSLVLLKDENNPPSKWTTARVVALHPGKDDITRVVSVRTSNGNVIKRSVVKVCPLPILDESSDSK